MYLSTILNSQVIQSPWTVSLLPNGAASRSTMLDFIAGDTVQLPIESNIGYGMNLPINSGSYSESYTLQAFAVMPTPEPSTTVLVGFGLIVLGLRSRRATGHQ